VTGIDISRGMLSEADRAAREAGVEVEWIQGDATRFVAPRLYDAAICLCEGGFGLLGADDDPAQHDRTILQNIYDALKPGASFILTTFNGIAKLRQLTQEDVEADRDPVTMVENSDQEWDLPEGKKLVHVKEHYYVPSELARLFEQVGFTVEHIWGGTAGNWGRRRIHLDEIEVMVVARKEK
jgi:SAM-dependent methyltransferase